MYDLAIIGTGAGGFAAAKYAARKKLKTILLEKNQETFGGTCLNCGCIPTKFFINSSKFDKNWQDVFKQKNEIIEKIKKPTLAYLEKEEVAILWGEAAFFDKHTIEINGNRIEAKNILIASGSSAKSSFKHKNCIFAEELFNQSVIKEKFLIIGAGYIGIEFASLLNSFGKDVTVIEKEENILPAFEQSLASRLRLILERKGIKIHTGAETKNYNLDEFDTIIVSVGRKPNIEKLMIENAGVSVNDNGWIKTDKFMRTNIKNIYACGDVTGKRLLAYAAEYQAKVCVDNITGERNTEDYYGMADCVFSLPQIAKVGVLEEEAKKKNIKYKVIKSNFLRFSSSYVYNDNDGFIQVLADKRDRIIGAGIISNAASELVSIFSLAIKNEFRISDLQKSFFIHPTLSEIIPLLLREVC